MSTRRRFLTRQLRHLVALLLIPILLASTGYALFSQQLSINTLTSRPGYQASQNMAVTYSVVYGTQGQNITYAITMVVKNNGATATESWSVLFDLPSAGWSNFGCASSVNCSTNGNRATIVSGSGNGTISSGGQTSFTFNFRSPVDQYQLQNINVSAVTQVVYQNISGLTYNRTIGTRTKKGKNYSWPYTFTVSNNSGQAITRWRIQATWGSSETVAAMASTVDYVAAVPQLTILSKTGMNNGTNFVFTATLSSTNKNWSLPAGTIQGTF